MQQHFGSSRRRFSAVSGQLGLSSRLIVQVGPFCRICRKGFSPQGEPWRRRLLHGGKACMQVEPIETDVITSVAHIVAASREILLGKEDLPGAPALPPLDGEWYTEFMMSDLQADDM